MDSIFQSLEWEKFKLKTGYEKSYRIEGVLVLQKKLPFGRSMLYSPMVSRSQIDQAKNLESRIREIAKSNNSIFYRLELDISKSSDFRLPTSDFKKSFEEMQPEHTLILDISKSEEEILSQMKQKGRYNIKIAQKNNIDIISSPNSSRELNQFYDLYSTMAKRHNITYRDKLYFEGLIDILGKKDYARTYIAQYKNGGKTIPVAGAIIMFFGGTAIYLYGGSSNEHRNLMAPYILHWQAILDAKEKGCKEYDFFGIAPNDNPRHPWAGVTRFKQQFGGDEKHILGSYDLLLRPLEYLIFKFAEKIRRH